MREELPWKLILYFAESRRAGQVRTLCPSLGSSEEGGAARRE